MSTLSGLKKVVSMNFFSEKRYVKSENIWFLRKKKILFSLMSYPLFVAVSAKVLFICKKLKFPYGIFLRNNIFRLFCAGENLSECKQTYINLQKKNITSCFFYTCEDESSEESYEENFQETLETMGFISKISTKTQRKFSIVKFTGLTSYSSLSRKENNKDQKVFLKRFSKLCSVAQELNISFMVDAEESWIQDYIDRIVLESMKKHNKIYACVYTTVQMYRHDRLEYLKSLIDIAKKQKFFVGVKLVRGAYMDKEFDFAKIKGTKNPIYSSKSETDHAYDEALKLCFANLDHVSLFAGSHNEESMDLFANMYQNLKEPRLQEKVMSSQLYGLGDYLSDKLAANKIPVCKYIPYGPVEKALPYLIRRAQENTWTSEGAVKEKAYINKLINNLKK
jgi:proline dehydrogenase